MEIKERVKQAAVNVGCAIRKLDLKVEQLETMIGKEMYMYILNELWDWTADVRKRMEGKI